MYHIPRFSTAFSAKPLPFSAKTANILHPFTFPFYTITETPDFCVKVYFCLIVRFLPLSPSYQRHLKTKKLGATTHRDEPHQTLKPLILSHSSILLPASTKNPMALFFYCRLCRCYTLMTFYPGVKISTPFTPPVRNLPHPICGSPNCDFAAKTPLFFCGIRYRMISAERSAAFDNSA